MERRRNTKQAWCINYRLYICLIIVSIFSILHSTTWHIKQDGTGNFTTIQEGINASSHTDTVLVYPSRYYENVNFYGKNITVASLELITGDEIYISNTIIDGNQQGSCVIIANEESNAVLRGFTITNGSGSIMFGNIYRLGGGILIYTPFQTNQVNASVINCRVHNNSAVTGGGIRIRNANVELSGVSVFNNQAVAGGGIGILYESLVTFDPENLCSVYNNFAGSIMDIFVSGAVNDVNVIVDTFTVHDNYHYYHYYNQQSTGTGILTFDIQNYSIAKINQDMYVSTDGNDNNSGLSPEGSLKTIAYALQKIESDSLDPKTVHVSSGTYSKELNDQIFPLGGKKFVNLIGEDMDDTILHNDYTENTYGMGSEKGHCKLQNFTFTSSGQLMLDVIGISICDNIQLINLSIEGNNLSMNYSVDLYRCYDVIINGLNVLNNTSEEASGFRFDGGNTIIKNSIFDNNDSIGPVQFISNFYCQVDDYLVLENCVFSNSDILPYPDEEYDTIQISAQQYCFPDIRINNCLFANNTTQNGSYIARISSTGSLEVNNCTFTQNVSHICPLGIFGDIDFRNNISYDNESDYEYEINTGNYPTLTSILNVEYCNIEGGESAIYPGNPPNLATINWLEGNINDEPLFLNSGDHPYQLSDISPCINVGILDTTGLNLPIYDLAGNPRVYGERIDIGAYENQNVVVGIFDESLIPITTKLKQNFPNPFNPVTTIDYSLANESNVELTIYNIKGQKVKQLISDHLSAGQYSIVWDGTDDFEKPVSSGIYFYKLKTNDIDISKKMLLLK